MRRTLALSLSLFVLATLAIDTQAATNTRLATITGSVRDNKGNPLAGALVSLLREGAKQVKEAKTDRYGNFIAKVTPGRYGIRAIANGFSEVVFNSVEVRASQELVYRFNLEPTGFGNTLPERRRDRDDVKWTLRSAQTRRSIFQVQEGEDSTVAAVTDAQSQPDTDPSEIAVNDTPSEVTHGRIKTRGVLETYFADSANGTSYIGQNFAFATPVGDRVELVFAGQTGIGADAPERLEASTLVRVGDRHRVGITAAGAKAGTPVWMNKLQDQTAVQGQFSLRAVDEWIVRDGIVIVLGLDYSRFIGGSSAHAITPRFGVMYDVNARTRLKAAFAESDEDGIQSVANFEGEQVVFRQHSMRPVAFVDGQAVLERSHRLEFGIERVLDNNSNLEATAFFDTTTGRGVGLLSTPATAFSGQPGENFIEVANQQGSSRGMRLVYTRRLNRAWTASAAYAFGRGQRLAPGTISDPSEIFTNSFFQTAALQLGGDFRTGTQVRTVLRFSPNATVFAIDPFAGRLGVYDPSLSIQVTQELPSFGLPVRAEAVLDARNVLDVQSSTENGEWLTFVGSARRSVRGGISVRF
jgi:hypothetical protein